MAKSLAFYRRLGLSAPASADGEGHVEVGLPGGLRLLFDTEDVIRSFHPDWTSTRGGRTGLAFALRGSFDKVATKVFLLSPADVDVSAEERRRIAEAGFYSYQ